MNQHTTRQSTPETFPEISPEEARDMVYGAELSARRIPAVLPSAFITLGMLCVVGVLGSIGLVLAQDAQWDLPVSPNTFVTLASLICVAVAILPVTVASGAWRRGTGRRWVAYMGTWALLWFAGTFTSDSWIALAIAPLFLVLFAVAFTIEVQKGRRVGALA
ncbi:MAG: hypothetical protein Q4G21_01265 [Dermabacter sp.]|nr:hypothetical protein [Dermabacter sp.]